ncbi:hypothetical protein AB3G45_02510 [Shinella sp. S4-D37]
MGRDSKTLDILREIGRSAQEIESLLARKIVACAWSRDYLSD